MAKVLHFDDFVSSKEPGVVVFGTVHKGTSAHSHDFFELVYIQSGFCLHESSNANTLLVEGDLFLVPPGVVHRYLGTGQISIFNCLFLKSTVSAFEGDLMRLPALSALFETDAPAALPKIHLDLDEQKRVSRLLKQMIKDAGEKESGWQLKVKCQLVCLLIDASRAFQKHVSTPNEQNSYPNYVSNALGIVNARYSDANLSVSVIAQETGVTPDYLSRQFKHLTGVGVQEYLRRYRFAKATELLLNGKTVSEVASDVGFASLCHFSREFKKELGVTPSAYARINS
ncbi:MAG: helix-turn-helix domain-containing protein [Clostridia bacterium]|nr:helix-turn-helix domain-containing protein [Clostridia bacterium]